MSGSDSLTEMGVSYRVTLHHLLTQAGGNFDFVGSRRTGVTELPDKDTEGHGGWRINMIQGSITGWLDIQKPDLVLLMIGRNDILQRMDGVGNAGDLPDDVHPNRAGNDEIAGRWAQALPN